MEIKNTCLRVLILGQNQTSIVKDDFECDTFSSHDGFVNDKLLQAGPRHKTIRSIWDGFYYCTNMATRGEPSTWFPRA